MSKLAIWMDAECDHAGCRSVPNFCRTPPLPSDRRSYISLQSSSHYPFAYPSVTMALFQSLFLLLFTFTFISSSIAWSLFINDEQPPLRTVAAIPHHDYDLFSIQQRDCTVIVNEITSLIQPRLQAGQFHNPEGSDFQYSTFSRHSYRDCPSQHRYLSPYRNPRIPFRLGPLDETSMRPLWPPLTPCDTPPSSARHPPVLSLGQLITKTLEKQGFQVRRLEIYSTEKGIHVKWDIVDPWEWNPWDWLEEKLFPERRWTREEEICSLKGFFNNPFEFFRYC